MAVDESRLHSLLGGDELCWLVQRVRARLENGRDLNGILTLRSPTVQQRAAIDRLFGRRPNSGSAISVNLSALDELIRRAEIADDLPTAIEALTGPIENRKERKLLVEREWNRLFSEIESEARENPVLLDYVQNLRVTGLLRRLTGRNIEMASLLAGQIISLSRAVPAKGLPLAELAATVTGDSHALDQGRPLGTLAVRLVANLGGIESWDGSQGRRDAWASVGVLCDELSASVLTLNLTGNSSSLTGKTLRLHADAGEPYRMTIRQLLRYSAGFEPKVTGATVYICENPTVVAVAANRLGSSSEPLVCIDGQPNTAAQVLLRQLASACVGLAYHGDFDWGGIRIANYVMRKFNAVPWRFSVADYSELRGGADLQGDPVTARWDTRLTDLMAERRRAILEEQVLEDLLGDIAR